MNIDPRTVLANKVVELLLTADALTLGDIANRLVASNHTKADTLEFALSVSMRDFLMSHGFSEKVNQ
jgi:hypothetical protein